ncbi:MAG: hypothetical protein H6Q08_2726 [Acidobacteria bacterium]|nr:hypothetical protein [Acidobacteriota bacterium]
MTANAPGRCVSTRCGDPTRPLPISAVSRAVSVDTRSGGGSGRTRSECCTWRAGAGSTTRRTSSMPASGGCDSRSSRINVRSTFGSRIGAGNSMARWKTRRVTSLSHVCTTTAPRSRRSRCAHSGSSRRASTNDRGSSPSMGHSSTSASSKRSSSPSANRGSRSSPLARRRQRTPTSPNRSNRSGAGSLARSPSVCTPQRSSVSSTPPVVCSDPAIGRCPDRAEPARPSCLAGSFSNGDGAMR